MGVIKAIDEVIRVDDRIYEGESFFISQLSKVVDFDLELFDRARKMKLSDAIAVLKTMPDDKKEDESSDQNIPSTSAAASAALRKASLAGGGSNR